MEANIDKQFSMEAETNVCEMEIANEINKAIQKDSFYTLPMKNILSIVGKSSIEDSFLICKLVERASKVKGDEAVLLLNVLDAKEFDFSECINIISKFTKCSFCKRIGMLYSAENDMLEHDYEYKIKILKEKIQNPEKGKEEEEIMSKSDDFESDIFKAAKEGKLTSVQYLVEKCHANVEAKDENGFSPLFIASIFNHLKIVKYLYEKCHADVESKDNENWTPIMVASYNSNTETVKYLYETCHADVNAINDDGETVLYKATENNIFETVKYLCETCHAKITDEVIEMASSPDIDDELKNYLTSKKHQ